MSATFARNLVRVDVDFCGQGAEKEGIFTQL